ncbi:hypothetical protein HYW76_05425 [Candidatus Pacearchaeota archaeon]|nr:hypothetical protein [Candidatus Pacearchaeota archaeon]
MQIIGFNFEKINSERKNIIKEADKDKFQVSSNIGISSVDYEKLEMVKDKVTLKFNFDFKVSYKPNIAEIDLSGYVLVIIDKEQAKKIIEKWKAKKISEDIRLPLFNFILMKCNLRSMQLEEEFSLPIHIPMPRLKAEDSSGNANYTG